MLQVKFASLNDSREIGLCLYNKVIMSAVGLTLALLLDGQEIMLYGVLSGCLIFSTTVTQLLLFVPKVMFLDVLFHEKSSKLNMYGSVPKQKQIWLCLLQYRAVL